MRVGLRPKTAEKDRTDGKVGQIGLLWEQLGGSATSKRTANNYTLIMVERNVLLAG